MFNAGLIVDISSRANLREDEERGSFWIPISSLVLGILVLLALLDDSVWDRDTIIGIAFLSIISLILGIVGINTQQKGKGLAIAGVIISSLSLIILAGLTAG